MNATTPPTICGQDPVNRAAARWAKVTSGARFYLPGNRPHEILTVDYVGGWRRTKTT